MDLFSDESDNELYEAGAFNSSKVDVVQLGSKNRRVNYRINYSDILSESEFIYRFRLTKEAVFDLLLEIAPSLTSSRNSGISPLHQLLLTLRFYALGTMLVSVADLFGVSIVLASRIVHDVSRAIASLLPKYVTVPKNTEAGFHSIAGFPRVLGAIGCAHVPIQSNLKIGEHYRNSEGIISIKVQGVCNADLVFMNVVARWPGSAHDAIIFDKSRLKVQCENNVFGNRWLIGDSAFPCRSYLLTPVLSPTSSNENRYNGAHALTRNPIERCFGVWKKRFPVMSLNISLPWETTQAVIVATTVLHNICRLRHIVDVPPEVDMPPENANIEVDFNTADAALSQVNQSERRKLIENCTFNG